MDRRRFLASAGAAAGAGLFAGSARGQQPSLRFSTPEADPQQIKAWEAIFADFKSAKNVGAVSSAPPDVPVKSSSEA